LDPLPIQTERLLWHSSFILFWVSRIFSTLGFQVASVAIGWLVYAKTGSAYALGLVGLFQFLPMVALTFLVGTSPTAWIDAGLLPSANALNAL
jgi:hypothetical protein